MAREPACVRRGSLTLHEIADLAGRQLEWYKPQFFRREYELRDAAGVRGTFRLVGRLGRTVAAGTYMRAPWVLEKRGYWHRRYLFRIGGDGTEAEEYDYAGLGWSEYASSTGPSATFNYDYSTCTISGDDGLELVAIHNVSPRPTGVVMTMTISPVATGRRDLTALIMLGMYMKVSDDALAMMPSFGP